MDRFDCAFEIKLAGAEVVGMTFSGYGSVFGNVDSYGDVIVKGAFEKSIKEAKASKLWPSMLLQHGGWGIGAEDMNPIGIWTEMKEDDTGLWLEGELADTTRGREMHTLMKMKPRPAINGLSIGYIPVRFKARAAPDEPRRTLEEVKLMEISPVTFPANPKARVKDVKNIEQFSTLADAERFLRDACGLSRGEAVTFVSRIKGLTQSDSDPGLAAVAEALSRRGASLNLNKSR
jgi:HK97 family phage prohead protease